MREILFRAWNAENNEMVNFRNNKLCNDQYQMQHLAMLMRGDYGDVLMQYTGLKDVSGVEIYEGDIVRDHNGVGEVQYSDKKASFKVNYHDGFAKWFLDYNLKGERESIKVIGNIRQNPELLERTNA